ncbi:hypothetical protein N9Z24_03750 [Gammaproteobacteria bacterium]|nr:hypothetical protein [Gammaproteobacteria bacterium]
MSLLDLASLVLAPTATKEGKVYSAIPDTGDGDMTFTRGSGASRINSAGLIEKERANLLLQSNTFNTTWAKSVTATLTSGQTGYDGSSNAWLFGKDATGFINLNQSISSLTGVGTLSIYAKANTNSNIIVRCIGGTDAQGFFDLSNGTLAAPSANCIDTNIEDIGNGWYRCSITFNTSSTTSVNLYPDYPFGGTNSGNIYIQDAMLNQGLVAQSYIETTTSAVYEGITDDVPRVDYSGGGCPALKLEPQRSNLVTQSEYIGDSTYISGGGAGATITRTDNYGISPDGTQNATRVEISRGSSYAELYNRITTTGGETYTLSFWAKSLDGTPTLYTVWNGDYYNEITFTNEWERYTYTFTASGSNNGFNLITWTGLPTTSTSADLLIWGVQIELGSYSTSYIPTYSVSSTRVADSCSKTGISELIGQSEGTLFAEFIMPPTGTLFTHYRISGVGGLYNDSQNITLTATNEIRGWSFSGTSEQAQINSGVYAEGTKVKVAYAFKTNDFILYVNGTQIGTDTSGSVPAMSEFLVGSYYPNTSLNVVNETKQAILFPTRLTNDQLSELTK